MSPAPPTSASRSTRPTVVGGAQVLSLKGLYPNRTFIRYSGALARRSRAQNSFTENLLIVRSDPGDDLDPRLVHHRAVPRCTYRRNKAPHAHGRPPTRPMGIHTGVFVAGSLLIR
jgi:hypothetical protein